MLPLRYDNLSPQLHSRREFLLYRQPGGSKAVVANDACRISARGFPRHTSTASFHDRCDRRVARPSPHCLDASGRRRRLRDTLAPNQIHLLPKRADGRTRLGQSCRRGERNIWQRRYWEHTIRDEDDFAKHVDYIHINPVKHGLVSRVRDWQHSSFHRMVKLGIYPEDWAGNVADGGRDFGERQ